MMLSRFFPTFRTMLVWLCLAMLAPVGIAAPAPLGTLVTNFTHEVVDFVRDPVRSRIYATTAANKLIVINTATVEVVSVLSIGASPLGLDISPDGTRLYVACSGSAAAGIGVVNLDTLQLLPSLPTPYQPADVAAGLGSRLYITPLIATASSDLLQISATTGAQQAAFGGSAFIHAGAQITISADRLKLFLGNVGVSPCNLARYNVSTATPSLEQVSNVVGNNGRRLILRNDGSALCYAVATGNTIVNGNSSYDLRLIPVGSLGAGLGSFFCGVSPANGVFSPDDMYFYTSPQPQLTVAAFNSSKTLAGSFPVPEPITTVSTDRRGRHLYVAGMSTSGPGRLWIYSTGRDLLELTFTPQSPVVVNRGADLSVDVDCSLPGGTFSATGLPPGVSIDPTTGVVSGSPTAAGNYAVDVKVTMPYGDTQTEILQLEVLTPFTVNVDGDGSVTPEYAGTTWRKIGASATLTAHPGLDQAFIKWSGSVASTANQIIVTISEDMTITARFVEKFNFTVLYDGPGLIFPMELRGLTTQDPGETVTLTATPSTGARFIGWTGAVTSMQNPIQVTVEIGAVITANFEPIPLPNFTLSSNGPGSVTGAPIGTTTYPLAKALVLTATPVKGARFSGWTGSVTSTQNPLSLTLLGDTNVSAQFESISIYTSTYRMLIPSDTGGVSGDSLSVTMTKTGAFTAKLRFGGNQFAFKGNAAALNGSRNLLSFPGSALPLIVELTMTSQGGTPKLAVKIQHGARTVTSTLLRKAVFPKGQPTPRAGAYTFHLPPPALPGGNAHLGYGFGTTKVTTTGVVQFAGLLGDGTPFAAASFLDENNDAILHTLLHAKKGFIAAKVHFDETPSDSDFSAVVNWSRPAQPKVKRYSGGFALTANLLGSRLQVVTNQNVLPFTAGHMAFEHGELASPQTFDLQLAAKNVLTVTSAPTTALKAKLIPKIGKLLGTFKTDAGKIRPFSGVVFQKTNIAVGQHGGTTEVGTVLLDEK